MLKILITVLAFSANFAEAQTSRNLTDAPSGAVQGWVDRALVRISADWNGLGGPFQVSHHCTCLEWETEERKDCLERDNDQKCIKWGKPYLVEVCVDWKCVKSSAQGPREKPIQVARGENHCECAEWKITTEKICTLYKDGVCVQKKDVLKRKCVKLKNCHEE